MRTRERNVWRKPLAQRRDGKALLLKWVCQFAYQWAESEPVTPETLSEWHLNDMDCRVRKPKCLRCWDTGHVGTGPAPPLTGISCLACKKNELDMAEWARVKALKDRVRDLERLLADSQLATAKGTE